MTSIFDITGDNFFTPLASKNKKIYIDTILYLHSLINELFEASSNEKNKIIDSLASHLDDLAYIELYDDSTNIEIEDNIDNYNKAKIIINSLVNYGWLVEEAIGDGKRAMDFSSVSYSFIALIEELMNNKKPSYTGSVRILKNYTETFDYTRIDSLEIIDSELSKLVVSLRGLRSSIQKYYKNITKNKSTVELEELLNEFTGEYKDAFFDSSYLRLKIIDNIDIEIPKIEDRLLEIFDDKNFINIEKLINSRIDKDYKTYEDALKYYNDTKRNIFINIRSIPSLIKMIDSKNNKYVTRTVSVIIHLINRGEDIEGILNRLISYIKDDKEIIDDKYLSIFEMKHYSFDLLAKPRKKTIKIIPEEVPIDIEISEEVKKEALKNLENDKKYNISNVNKFVLDFLNGEKQKEISNLEIKSKFEFIMIICIIMYSKIPNAIYDLKPLDERIHKNNVSFNNFIVRIKGGYND